MAYLTSEYGPPLHLIMGVYDLAYLGALIAVGLICFMRGTNHETGFLLGLMLAWITAACCRFWLQTEPGIAGAAIAGITIGVFFLMARDVRESGRTWAKWAQLSFGLGSAIVGLATVLSGGSITQPSWATFVPGYLVLAFICMGLWEDRALPAWPAEEPRQPIHPVYAAILRAVRKARP